MKTPEPENAKPDRDTSFTELENRLDDLWQSYLVLLDCYTKAQENIETHMSFGFLSLAKAQSSAAPGRRYGQDWYDERMKSSTRVHVSSNNADTCDDSISAGFEALKIEPVQNSVKTERKHNSDEHTHAARELQPMQQPSPPGTPEPEAEQQTNDIEKSEKPETPDPVNPLRWYGILVPPELKRAQSSFSMVVGGLPSIKGLDVTTHNPADSPLISAVNAARGLRVVEAELRKIRKAVKKAERARITTTS